MIVKAELPAAQLEPNEPPSEEPAGVGGGYRLDVYGQSDGDVPPAEGDTVTVTWGANSAELWVAPKRRKKLPCSGLADLNGGGIVITGTGPE